jgi:hypothetical protein
MEQAMSEQASLDNQRRTNLQWLADTYKQDLKEIREMEEKLFSWTTSTFLAGLGVLTGFRTVESSWAANWRVLLCLALLVVVGGILMVAYRLRLGYEYNRTGLTKATRELLSMPEEFEKRPGEDRGFFYVRWGAIAVLVIVNVIMVWNMNRAMW